MKTLLLFTTGLLLSITTVSATEAEPKPKRNHINMIKHYRFAEPIVFMERGIEFYVFPDGNFDFDIQQNFYYNASNTKRTTISARYAAREQRVHRFNRRMIVKNRFGMITRIGNTRIYYNRMGNVTQIGTVDIDYRRGHKTVSKVGGLRVNYNHWGQIVHTSGYVNHNNRDSNCQAALFNDSFYNKYDDDDYIYYKKHGKVKKLKKKHH